MLLVCECGTSFPASGGKRYCSESCRKSAESKRRHARRRVPTRNCADCGEPFEWGRGKRMKFCSDTCQRRSGKKRRGELYRPAPAETRTCQMCEMEFVSGGDGKRGRSKYCSAKCCERAQYLRNRKPDVARECPVCGSSYTGRRRSYCSDFCRTAVGRATNLRLPVHDVFAAMRRSETCESCGGPGECLDHCHSTMTVRGILCSRCNHALGHAKDNSETLLSLVSYLERSRFDLRDLLEAS